MGAVYLETGIEWLREFVEQLLESVYPKIDMESIFKDYKTTLQELTQARFGVTPEYVLLRAFGPDHKKEFEVAIKIHDRTLASAKGKSKKEAQQEAARLTLAMLTKEKA
jgi:ribonuclease-3